MTQDGSPREVREVDVRQGRVVSQGDRGSKGRQEWCGVPQRVLRPCIRDPPPWFDKEKTFNNKVRGRWIPGEGYTGGPLILKDKTKHSSGLSERCSRGFS